MRPVLIALGAAALVAGCTSSRPNMDDFLSGEKSVRELATTPGGERAAFVTDAGNVSFFDSSQPGPAKLLWKASAGQGQLHGVAVSPDGRSVLSASFDGTVARWDATRGVVVQRFPREEGGQTVAFSPDGQRALALGSGALRLLALAPAERDFEPVPHVNSVGLVFGPDPDHVLAESGEGFVVWEVKQGTKGSVKVIPWEVRDGSHQNRIDQQVVFSKDGKRLLCGGHFNSALWDLEKNVAIWTVGKLGQRNSESISFAEDETRVLLDGGDSYDRTVLVLDAGTGEERSRIRLVPKLPPDERYGGKAFVEAIRFVDGGRAAILLVDTQQGTEVYRVSL